MTRVPQVGECWAFRYRTPPRGLVDITFTDLHTNRVAYMYRATRTPGATDIDAFVMVYDHHPGPETS